MSRAKSTHRLRSPLGVEQRSWRLGFDGTGAMTQMTLVSTRIHALGITTRDLYPTRTVRILTRRVIEDHNVFSYLRFGLDSLAAAMSWSGWARVLDRLQSERRNDEDDEDDAGLMKFHTWNSERTTWTWLFKERPDGSESGFAKCYPALNQVRDIRDQWYG